MLTLTLSADQVSALAAKLPPALLGREMPWSYDAGTQELTITDDALASAVQAIAAIPGWDAGAAALGLVVRANAKQWALATGGFTVTLGGQPVNFATDEVSYSFLMGKYLRLAQPNPPASIAWQIGPTAFVSIAASDFAGVATKIADFVQATFDALHTVLAAIAAGTITTEAQVDAAAWPAASG